MTAEQKAKELVEKYQLMAEIKHIDEPTEIKNPLNVKNAKIELASKKCALIAVDEIIDALKITIGHCELRKLDWHEVQSDFAFWIQVKTKIETLS